MSTSTIKHNIFAIVSLFSSLVLIFSIPLFIQKPSDHFMVNASSLDNFPTDPDWVTTGTQQLGQYGIVSPAGDLNGDGFDDIAVGSTPWPTSTLPGKVDVYYGSSSGLSLTPDLTITGNQAGAQFGTVMSAGDVNADGFDDLLVGAPAHDNGNSNEGKVFLYYGSSSGLITIEGWTYEGNSDEAKLGSLNIKSYGDINKDGYSDVLISSLGYESGKGRTYAFYGSSNGLGSTPSWVVTGDQAGSSFGVASFLGDVNNDGYLDVGIGAQLYDNGQTNEGRAFVYYGSPSGLSLEPDWIVDGNISSLNMGFQIAPAGDVNNDGYSDFAVSCYSSATTTYVYYGSASGPNSTPNWTKSPGIWPNTVGDVNFDGFDDLIIGYPWQNSAKGQAWIYPGSPAGLLSSAIWTDTGETNENHFGWPAGSAGDINRDGAEDLIIGAHAYNDYDVRYGRAYLYQGTTSHYSIFGSVSSSSGTPISGININLYNSTGDLVSNVSVNSDSIYSFTEVPEGTYTITPSKSGYSFSPVTRSVTIPPNASGQDFAATPVTKPWLLMYYLAGDNSWSPYNSGFIQTLKNADNNNINIAIFDDQIDAPTQYIGINANGENSVQKNELDTGDPQTLIDFITWAKTNYPAEHTALVIADHGNALHGVAVDKSAGENLLSPPELKQAFFSAGGVDVLQMYTCLMANLEAQYQLRGLVNYYIGSENENWSVVSIDRYVPDVNSTTTPEQLAVQMAKSYQLAVEPLNEYPSNISVVDMSKIHNLASKTSAMADVIRSNWLTTSFFVWGITDSSVLQRFDSDPPGYVIDNKDVLVDLYHFASMLSEEPKFYTAAHDVMSAVKEFVIYNDQWSGPFEIDGVDYYYDLTFSYGVSIGLPRTPISYYNPDWLDFAEGADWVISPWSVDGTQTDSTGLSWGAFVSDLVKEYNPSAPDSPNPPDLVSPLPIDTPVIAGINPARVLAGFSDLTLTVNGVGFMTDSVINWNGVSRPTTYISGTKLTTQIFASDLENVGSAQVTVTTPDVENGTSDEYEFFITDHLPDSAEKLNASKATFSWVAIPDAMKYKIQLSTKPDFSVLLLNVKVTEPTHFFDSILQYNKTYYWRIRPIYATSKGAWLPTWNFTSMDALVKPELISPAHKQIMDSSDVALAWESVENVAQYKVVIAKDALFQNKVTSLKTADTTAMFNLPNGKYYWRVRALDPYGAKGPWSDYRKFTVDAE